ncbi:MAG: DEAD/DEAH box helicase family protein [bacterium]|jgi:type III restriction enzyme
MIQLKEYQHRVLTSVRDFLAECARTREPASAFGRVTKAVYGSPLPYNQIADPRFERMPYVCVRVPTGGGKTLLACHTVGIALNRYLPAPHALVLWLVPSNTILNQTADALRDPRHPYRRALELECGGPVEVMTIDEALRMTRATVEGATVVIVSTIQCFRTSDPEGRKVYDGDNSHMASHMAAVPADRYPELDMGPDGRPKSSLINVLRYRRPIVIVDEAHNARTDLSFAMLANVLPACIIEFTATPDTRKNPSNVLHRVSAAELKAENMVKLPLRVITRHPGQKDQLLAEAIALRADLERLAGQEAQSTGEYVRPILLIQADRVDACPPLRERLVGEFGLVHEEIKISTGKLDELKGINNISDPACAVRFIITVEKLREGWDCPFAYVLCSLRETRSATAIEQIVGRILRLPHAIPKQNADLNCAFMLALAEGNHLEEVLAELRDALVSNGFTPPEAEAIIIPVTHAQMPLGTQPKTVMLPPEALDGTAFRSQSAVLAGKVRMDEAKGEITVFVPLTKADEESLLSCVKTTEAREQVAEAVERVRQIERVFGTGETRVATPYEQQMDFIVPLLCVIEEGRLFEFEKTHLIEYPWKLSAKNAELAGTYDPRNRPGIRTGNIDILKETGKVSTEVSRDGQVEDFIGRLHQQVMGFSRDEDWTLDELIQWLDSKIEHTDIPPGESAEFLRKCLRGLMARYGLTDITVLTLDRFRLRDEVENLIESHRGDEHGVAFQKWLLPESALTVSVERGLDLSKTLYEPSWVYEGSFVFKKHYYGSKPGELRECKADGNLTEEFQCAQFLDGLEEVAYWVRNLSRKPSSFRLQTSTDYFYPDFVCRLKDGRILVVEFKGGGADKGWYALPESEEKRLVGAIWAKRSNSRCLFIMPKGKDFEAIRALVALS